VSFLIAIACLFRQWNYGPTHRIPDSPRDTVSIRRVRLHALYAQAAINAGACSEAARARPPHCPVPYTIHTALTDSGTHFVDNWPID
jgi:hypothetical protein